MQPEVLVGRIVVLVIGLVLLVKGSDFFVKAAAAIANIGLILGVAASLAVIHHAQQVDSGRAARLDKEQADSPGSMFARIRAARLRCRAQALRSVRIYTPDHTHVTLPLRLKSN
jgi:hypothetical protein